MVKNAQRFGAKRSMSKLDLAHARLVNIQSQAGRINSRDLQRNISRIFMLCSRTSI